MYDEFDRPIYDLKDVLDMELIDYNNYDTRVNLKSGDLINALLSTKYFFVSIAENGNGIEVKVENDETDDLVFQQFYSPNVESKEIIMDIYEFLLKAELQNLQMGRESNI